jgi:cell division septation protein DedD
VFLLIRTFIVALLLAVFFLSGTLYGMDRDRGGSRQEVPAIEAPQEQQESAETLATTKELEEMEKIEELRAAEMNEKHFTVKTASFLETAVKGFYEIVVEMLYQISSLFF